MWRIHPFIDTVHIVRVFLVCTKTWLWTIWNQTWCETVRGLPRLWTVHSLHTHAPAGPPTLLEDRQRYRGNQLKQSLDGRKVVCLTGKDMHHLKEQNVKSHLLSILEAGPAWFIRYLPQQNKDRAFKPLFVYMMCTVCLNLIKKNTLFID